MVRKDKYVKSGSFFERSPAMGEAHFGYRTDNYFAKILKRSSKSSPTGSIYDLYVKKRRK